MSSCSESPVTSAPGNPMTSSELYEQLYPTYAHIIHVYIHENKQFLKLNTIVTNELNVQSRYHKFVLQLTGLTID